jgi:predicted transposase YdaD
VEKRLERQSRLGWTKLTGEWNVVELWKESAEELLAANDPGLAPWATLAAFQGPPETLLERCREQIERQAPLHERENLLAVTQVLARLRYPQPELLSILGGKKIMIDSPLIREIIAESKQETILQVLEARFGAIPPEVTKRLRTIRREKKLKELINLAAVCKRLEEFRDHLLS